MAVCLLEEEAIGCGEVERLRLRGESMMKLSRLTQRARTVTTTSHAAGARGKDHRESRWETLRSDGAMHVESDTLASGRNSRIAWKSNLPLLVAEGLRAESMSTIVGCFLSMACDHHHESQRNQDRGADKYGGW